MFAHIDADSFFASVLVRKHPHLQGKPLFALGMGGGFIIAASYEARAFGVKTGMRLSDAIKLVPHAVQMKSDFRETGVASEQIEMILQQQCPLVEQMSIDEWYMDLNSVVAGCPQNLSEYGQMVRLDVLKRTGLSVSVGIAPTKLLAKMAGEYRKPGGVTVVFMNDVPVYEQLALDQKRFLRDRPAAAIPGIGRQRSIHAERHKWHTAWDIAMADSELLRQLFGRPGVDLKRELNGEVLSPVTVDHSPQKSISRCRSFKATHDKALLLAHVLRHLEYTVLKMRRQNLACRGVSVWLRDHHYEHAGYNATVPQPADTEEQLRPYIERCFKRAYQQRTGYTQAGLTLWKLVPTDTRQISLFENQEESLRDEQMQKTLDILHERFGRNSITRGAAIQVKSGTKRELDLPILE